MQAIDLCELFLSRGRRIVDTRLTTCEILYRLPDARSVLQVFIYQLADTAPRFPRLCSFLDYWERHIEAPIHSVRVASAELGAPASFRRVDGLWRLH